LTAVTISASVDHNETKMGVFAALRSTRAFRRRHMQFLQSQEDHDLVLEIGFHQERGKPLTVKQLQLQGLVTVPTLQRRLRRLRQAGALVVKRSATDGRAVELTLSPRVTRAYARFADILRTILTDGATDPAPGNTDDAD
jgi:DNA-binding MarR family transcriptional regulator